MQTLRGFGLSESAARAYLALLDLGLAEARDVSRLAKIPLAKVYQTLNRLQEHGLVAVIPTSPRQYEPIPFAQFVEKLRERRLQEARELEKAAPELAALFPAGTGRALVDRGGVRVVKGRRESLQALRSAASKATRSILVAPALGWTKRASHMRTLLEDANARGLALRILAHPQAKADRAARVFADLAQIRVRDGPPVGADPVGTWFFDDEKTILVHFVPDDESTADGKDVALVIEEEAIVEALQRHLEARWSMATPLPSPRYR